MFLRILTLAGGIGGAATLSQFPEFSQQYLQRLAGQVDALGQVVTDFDTSATRAGLDREAALTELSGTVFLDGRQTDMRRAFVRHERLVQDLTMLRIANPLERMAMPQRLADPETLEATWTDFRPALPLTMDGGIAAGIGFGLGWLLSWLVLSVLAWPFRRAFA